MDGSFLMHTLVNLADSRQHWSHVTSFGVSLMCLIISAGILTRFVHVAEAESLKTIHPRLTLCDGSDFPVFVSFLPLAF